MYHRQRQKIVCLLLSCFVSSTLCKSIVTSEKTTTDPVADNFENNIIDFDEDYTIKFNKKYGVVPWDTSDKFNKEIHRYTVIKDKAKENFNNVTVQNNTEITSLSVEGTTSMNDYSVIPLELISTTENELSSIIDSTTEDDLTVIPLTTTNKIVPNIEIKQTVILPSSTQISDTTEYEFTDRILSESDGIETTTIKREVTANNTQTTTTDTANNTQTTTTDTANNTQTTTTDTANNTQTTTTDTTNNTQTTTTDTANNTQTTTTGTTNIDNNTTVELTTVKDDVTKETKTIITTAAPKTQEKVTTSKSTIETLKTNSSKIVESRFPDSLEFEEDVPSFSELDTSDETEVPEDYYDSKDVIPTTAPKNDALSVIFGLAGSVVESVVESVAERVVPKSIYDLFKRMQKQNEALEAERLRSREENGGLGQIGRGILKSISSGLSKPLSQLMAGVRDIGSLDSDRGFLSSVSSVANVATSLGDAFKDRVQAIYPGTVWCGDGHSATARSSDLGLFFFTDTCCRQHDACKIFIRAGDTKYGLTNTGLFTRSHCSCDIKFRECLRKTNSLVSAQIGLTYFNVLGPQCFRKAHPIVKCNKRTRITGQKCEEYELDYTKPKMWQWFDNETF